MKRPVHLSLAAQLRRRRGETAELHVIAPAAERARKVRRALGEAVRTQLREHGDTLAAYALVTWDMRGAACTHYFTRHGPVGAALMPMFVAAALDRCVAGGRADTEPMTGEAE